MDKRVALITGAAGNIGTAIALELAGDGFDIALSDLDRQTPQLNALVQQLHRLGTQAISIPADVTNKADVQAAVDTTTRGLGRFDVMINNAGISQVRPFLELSEADLEAAFRVNVYGVVYGIQAAAEKFRELNVGGTIISAGSVSSYRGNPDLAQYSASKFAVRGVTQAAARALGKYGITVNAYAPGIVEGDMWNRIDADLSQEKGKPIGQSMDDASRDIALGRRAQPVDIGRVVSFLASEKAAYITGQVVVVDGGLIYT